MTADKVRVNRLLKTARGQLDGIIKMVDEGRYCIDISNQLLAIQAILNKVNKEVIHAHLGSCVKEAFRQGNEDEKINEIMMIMDKLF